MKIFNTVITIILSLLLTVSLCVTLALNLIYCTLDTDTAPTSIASFIDENKLSAELSGILSTTVKTYGFDASEIANKVNTKEAKRVCGEYIGLYFNAFITGATETPIVVYKDDGSIYNAINENKHLSSRPELFENEENVRLLADKCVSKINSAINALSIDKVLEIITHYKGLYIKVASLGKYFMPATIITALLLVVTCTLIIFQKRRKTAYGVSLALFGVSAVFSVPFVYFSTLDIATKLNINAGLAKVYADALFRHVFSRMALIYTSVSALLLIMLILSIIRLVQKETNQNNKSIH